MRKQRRSDDHRLQLVALAYLLRDFQDLDAIGRYIPRALGNKVFGHEAVDVAVDRVCQELLSWGYGRPLLFWPALRLIDFEVSGFWRRFILYSC